MSEEFARNLRLMSDQQFREFMKWAISDFQQMSATFQAKEPAARVEVAGIGQPVLFPPHYGCRQRGRQAGP